MNGPWPPQGAPKRILFAVALAALLPAWPHAQAGTRPDAWRDGWRSAKVLALLEPAQAAPHAFKDCRVLDDPTQPRLPYVLVSYAWGHHPGLRHQMVATWSGSRAVRVGDAVRVNIRDCSQPARPR